MTVCILEIGLAAPGTPASPNKPNAVLVFESSTLEGIPGKPLCMCSYPPELRRASIPIRGPELIYQTVGRIEYQNALIGAREMGPGEIEGIPPGVAVQKRNPFAQGR